jgi:5'-phosphate synthase pdxT subunit
VAKIGVLALQGAFARHASVLARLGAEPREVRTPAELADVAGLVIPGGESTTMSMLLERGELFEPLAERLHGGMPVFGTCAGMILLARDVIDGRPDQRNFGVVDIAVRRNGFGRQVDSFEAPIALEPESEVGDVDRPFPGVFIRAPIVEEAGPDAETLARFDGRPVLCRQGRVLVAAFHPELSGDDRLHELFLREI